MPRPAPQDRIAARIARQERDAEATRLSALGFTYEEIAQRLGFRSRQNAHAAVKRVLQQRIKESNEAADLKRAQQETLLNEVLKVAQEIMDKDHLAHSNGRIVQRVTEDGQIVNVLDDGPRLAAADRLIKASESLRKLYGLDAPSKVEQSVSGSIGYVINVSGEEMDKL